MPRWRRKMNLRALLAVTALLAASSLPAVAATETVLYAFKGGTDGKGPVGALVRDASGALYGTTRYGGWNKCSDVSGCGTVFKLTPPAGGSTTWAHTVIHRFTGGADGANPAGGLIMDANGELYGIAGETFFRLTPPATGKTAWIKRNLYTFRGGPDGSDPHPDIFMAANGYI